MSRTVNSTDRPVPPPSLSGVRLWDEFSPEWNEPVANRRSDPDRTARLQAWDDRVRCHLKGPYPGGIPWQRVDGVHFTRVWYASQRPTFRDPFPCVRLPLPSVVRRYGDPSADWTDAQWFGIDLERRVYYEASSIGPAFLGFPHPWRADNIKVYDLSRDWRSQDRSITGSGVPMLPMVPRPEELRRGPGGVTHALHFVAAGYAPEMTGIARKTDGTIPGHPLRAGERLRLRADRTPTTSSREEEALVQAMLSYGLIVTDRTSPDAGHNIRLPSDPTLSIDLTSQLRLTDFEVLR